MRRAEDGIVGSILKDLGIEPAVVLAQSVSFLILLGVLWRYLYGPIESIMRQRQEQVANSLANAEAQQLQAASLRKEYEGHLANVADEARAKLEQAMKDAEAARVRLLETAQDEVRDLHQRAQAQLALEREQLRRELRAEMSDIAVMAAAKALRTQLTPTLQTAVIDQVIRDLDQPVQH